uniref:Uncharacterized protein n=1 Tax=Hyaloperonospora arabidopsidis (strain Emoy2) TaxID=559515 RepID=M4B203_HYAAE
MGGSFRGPELAGFLAFLCVNTVRPNPIARTMAAARATSFLSWKSSETDFMRRTRV